MATRRVTLPDGRVIKVEGAPDYVTDNELVAQFAPEFIQEEDEEESFFDTAKDFASDAGEWAEDKVDSISDFGRGAIETAQDFAESTASGFATVGENIMTAAGDVGSFVAGEDSDFVQFVRNKVEESREARDWVETRTADSPWASTIGNMAPIMLGYVGTGGAVFQAGRAAGLGAFKSGVLGGIISDQVIADREETIFNALVDPLDIEEGSMLMDYFVTNPEEDSIAEQRLKLLVSDGLIFGGTIGLIMDTPLLGKIADKAFKKPWKALKESEKVDAVMSHMKETKQKLWKDKKLSEEFMVENPNTGELEPVQPRMSMKAPTPEQVLEQNRSFFRRMWQVGFTKEGWSPAEIFNAFEGAQAAKRMFNERAENISNRLAISLKDIASEYPVQTKDAVNDLMFNRFQWLDAAEVDEKDIAKFSQEYGLPETAVEEIVNARELIDRLSKTITNSDVIDSELRQVIEDNIGTYFNRSYRLFEDARWVPDNTLYQDTLNKYTADLMKQDPKLSLQDAANTARDRLEDLLSQGHEDNLIASHITNIRKLNKDVLLKRKEIPDYIRKFMGEITDPEDRLMITVKKLSEFSENAKFFDTFVKEGKKAGYVADEATGIFTTKITGTKFPGLDGLYTTPEIASAIEGRQGRLLSMMTYGGKNPVLNEALHNFFALKGFSQKTKTVYSHVTHLRNFLGGIQFGLANGSNPFAETSNAFKILKNQLKNMGDKELDEMYEEFLEMGLINTNVRVQEFRKLLREGEDYFLEKSAGKFAGYLQRSGVVGDKTIRAIDQVSDFTEQLYMATDDFFKINGYYSELDTLKAAYPDANLADLKKEAANIIRDTYPSYDRVSPAIKGLRELPLGNFVAFPAEILRNSYHIIRRGFNEVVSDSEIIRARGMRRLAGYLASASAWSGASYATAALAGLTEEEKKAMAKVAEAPWTSGEPLYFRDEETGELAVVDTTSLNSYNYVRGMFSEPIAKILKGEMTNESFEETSRKAVWDFVKHTAGPFVEPSMFTDGFRAVGEALASPTGETLDGRKLFPPGMPMDDMIYRAFEEVVKPFVPGSYYSIEPFFNLEKLDEVSGMPRKTLSNELITNFSGIKFTRVDPQANLTRKAYQYQRESKSKYNLFVSYEDTPEDVITRYIDMQQKEYRLQRDLYEQYKATETLLGTREAYKLLRDAGFSRERATQFRRGFFTPTSISKNKIRSIQEKVYSVDKEFDKSDHPKLLSLVRELKRLGYAMSQSSLESFEETEEGYTEGARMLRAEGGLVDPAMRRDPYTGRPYAATAKDLIDPLQRLGFVQGGYVRQQYSLGGQVLKGIFKTAGRQAPKTFRDKSIFRASESLAANPLTSDDLYAPIKISFMGDNISKDRLDVEDMFAGDEHTIYDMTDPQAMKELDRLGYNKDTLDNQAFMSIRKRTKYSDQSEEEIPMFFQDEDEILEFYNKGVGQYDTLRGAKHSATDGEFSKMWREQEDLDSYEFIDPVKAAKIQGILSTDLLDTIARGLYIKEDIQPFIAQLKESTPEVVDFIKTHIKPVSKDVVRRVRQSPKNTQPHKYYFHGTQKDFDEFDRSKTVFVSEDPDIASEFAGQMEGANVRKFTLDSLGITNVQKDIFDPTNPEHLEKLKPFYEGYLNNDNKIDYALNQLKNDQYGFEGTDVESALIASGLFKGYKVPAEKAVAVLPSGKGKFLRGSTVKVPVYRGTNGDEPTTDMLVALVNPREIGLHVGANAGQPNILMRPGSQNYIEGTDIKPDEFDAMYRTVSANNYGTVNNSIILEDDELAYFQNALDWGIAKEIPGIKVETAYLDEMGNMVDDAPRLLVPVDKLEDLREFVKGTDGAPNDAFFDDMLQDIVEINPRQVSPTISEYYINIKNPLKAKEDIGVWNAEAVIPQMRKLNPRIKPKPIKVVRDMSRKLRYFEEFNAEGDEMGDLVNEYIMATLTDDVNQADAIRKVLDDKNVLVNEIDTKIKEFSVNTPGPKDPKGGQVLLDSIEDQIGRKLTPEEWDKLESINLPDDEGIDFNQLDDVKLQAEQYKTNREFQQWLKDFGFDSIEYVNTGEASFEGADPRSWIIFDHSQIKSARAESFDITDPRVSKAMGGLVRLRSKYSEGGRVEEDPSMYRRDGAKKSARGYLGPVENKVQGGTMTEVSVGIEIEGEEIEIPTMVPTLTPEEVEILSNMQLEGNAKNIPRSIIIKAKEHAMKRMKEGKSPFYQDGEDREGYMAGGMVEIPKPPMVEESGAADIVNPPLNQSTMQVPDAFEGSGLILNALKRKYR